VIASFPDFWADRRTGQSFRPGRVAAGERAAWILDMWLPVLVRVDPSTHSLSDPFRLPRTARRTLDVSGLTAGEGAVWALWPDCLVRVDEETGSTTAISVPIKGALHSIGVGGGAAWVLGGGRIARVDASTGTAELFLDQTGLALPLVFGFGHLWTMSRPDAPTQRSVLSRYSPGSPDRPIRLEIAGRVENIAVGDNAVWMRCDRLANEGLRTFVIRVNPETLGAVEHEISSDEAFFAVGNEIWLGPTLASHDVHTPTDLRRVDPTTWKDIGVIRAEGLVSALSVGSSGRWGLLRRAPGSDLRVCQIDPNAKSMVSVLDLADVDARPFLPSPPESIDPELVERELRDALAEDLPRGGPALEYARGTPLENVVFEEIRLEGSFPKTQVVILFRSHHRPEVRFGHREWIWSDNGVYVAEGSGIIATNLEETLIFAPGLPLDAEPDATGVIWI
jgi:hypothetical protein